MDEEHRRAAARRWFWSDHPLNLAFREERKINSFSLKEFISFVKNLPAGRFHSLIGAGQ